MKKPSAQNPTLEQMVKAAHDAGAVISFGLEAHDSFYGQIEEGVREWVRMLRNAGINTVSSCHHDGYIIANSENPTAEINIISNVLRGRIQHYDVMVLYHHHGVERHQCLEIRSPDFRLKTVEKIETARAAKKRKRKR